MEITANGAAVGEQRKSHIFPHSVSVTFPPHGESLWEVEQGLTSWHAVDLKSAVCWKVGAEVRN